MQVIQNGINYLQGYYANMPDNIARNAAAGAITSSTLHLLFGCGHKIALISGALCFTATIVEAIIRPIIANIFQTNNGDSRFISFFILETISVSTLPQLTILGRVHRFLIALKLTALWDKYDNNKNSALPFLIV